MYSGVSPRPHVGWGWAEVGARSSNRRRGAATKLVQQYRTMAGFVDFIYLPIFGCVGGGVVGKGEVRIRSLFWLGEEG